MIVLAADYVGYQIARYLIEWEKELRYVILDRADRGGYNEAVIRLAESKQIAVEYDSVLKDPGFLNDLEQASLSLGILAWWPYILKGRWLELPERGWVNTHPGLLPYNRGKHPYFWSMVEGTPYGVTLQFIDEGIDTGDVIVQKKIEVDWEDTGATLYRKSSEAMIQLFIDSYSAIKDGTLLRQRQNDANATYHHSSDILKLSTLNLDEEYSARTLFNVIRGRMFPPSTNTFFYDDGKKYSVEILIKQVHEEQL